ncbi:phosphodiesterase [Vulgatibacter sp.]|uniref:phosphodiesterase n=1 Tax=Vulgatibacter sp. TaxID=1971226 RepID=UPI0035644623
MKILWLSDLHVTAPGAPAPAGVDPNRRLRSALDHAVARHADADLLVITGDLVQGRSASAYPVLRGVLADLTIPVRLLLGNHDDRDAFFDAFPDAPRTDGYAQFMEKIGGYRVVYLDTLAADGKHHGELCARRLEWLERVLADGDEPTLIFMHHPPFDVGVPGLDALKLVDGDRFASVLQPAAVRQIFCGHLHRSVGGSWSGIPVSVIKSPHVGFALEMTERKLVRSDDAPGYGVVLADREGVVVHLEELTSPIERG